jgi:hypothetical protein
VGWPIGVFSLIITDTIEGLNEYEIEILENVTFLGDDINKWLGVSAQLVEYINA